MKKLLLATAFVSFGTAGFSETMQPKMSPEEFVSISTQGAASSSVDGNAIIAIIFGLLVIAAAGGTAAPQPS